MAHLVFSLSIMLMFPSSSASSAPSPTNTPCGPVSSRPFHTSNQRVTFIFFVHSLQLYAKVIIWWIWFDKIAFAKIHLRFNLASKIYEISVLFLKISKNLNFPALQWLNQHLFTVSLTHTLLYMRNAADAKKTHTIATRNVWHAHWKYVKKWYVW